MSTPEFKIGQPILEVATGHLCVIWAIGAESGTHFTRFSYDLVDMHGQPGSSGVTPNMLEPVIGVLYTHSALRSVDADKPSLMGAYEVRLVLEDGNTVAPPSEEYVVLVKQWLKRESQ